MPVAPGVRLGPYEIQCRIGAGGMGEVYRARDPRLGRDVAIKVLPADLTADADALARFRREARAVAALSHPNILSIHELGTDGGTVYAVTELLEGETLRQRLARGALPVRQAVGLAIQIAEGLVSAHEKGIAHRDLKPENIFLTDGGSAKILDFGLARRSGDTQTQPVPLTAPGTVMGTVGYMSPEQVRGEEAGAASDIFSFGCVLYEMLRGAPPFGRPTAAEILTAVLRDDPLPLTEQAREIPAGLAALVSHCLEKRPRDRFQSTSDMVFALRTAGTPSHVSGRTSYRPEAGPLGRRLSPAAGWTALAGFAAVGIGVVVVFATTRNASPGRPERYTQLTFEQGAISNARFGADGKSVAFSAAWQGQPSHVFVKLPDNPDALPMGTPGTELMAVSSSGDLAVRVESSQTAAFGFKGVLARMTVLGGAPRQLRDGVSAADWLRDGQSLAVATDLGDRQRLDCGPGTKPYETRGWISDLRVAPRGNLVAFLEHPSLDAAMGSLIIYDCSTQDRTALAAGRVHLGLAWHPETEEVWFGQYGGVRAITLDGRERAVLQMPESVHLHDIAADGRVLLSHESLRMRMALRTLDDDRVRDLSWMAWSLVFGFSPDGKRLLFTEFPQQSGVPGAIAAIRGVDGSPVVRLGEGFVTSVSHDGRWAVATRKTAAAPSQLVLLPMGTGEVRRLRPYAIESHASAVFVPGDDEVVFIGREAGHGARLYRQAVSGGPPTPISPEGISLSIGVVAPDGTVAAANWQGGRPWLFPIHGGEPRSIPGANAGEMVAGWAPDSRRLYVRGLQVGTPLRKLSLADGTEQIVTTLQAPNPAGVMWIGPVVVAPDERSVAFSYFRALSSLYVVTGLNEE
jgi:eukaryotic-like serine/threonine-protein kinase